MADEGEYVKDLEQTYAGLVAWVRKMTALSKAAREEAGR